MTEKRIYIIIPRNLDVPGDPPQKVTVTCGAAAGYAAHAAAMLQLELVREEPSFSLWPDVSFQFILTLMVSHSAALGDAAHWLHANGIRYWKYLDEDKKEVSRLFGSRDHYRTPR